MKLFLEGLLVGIATVIMGSIVGYIVGKFFSVDLPTVCKKWNKNYLMEICLFLTGFLLHIVFEITGVNKLYCKNGIACRKFL